ncbi:MAG: TetR/AcrR family transcriptional regulator [Actinomycetota bacterium]
MARPRSEEARDKMLRATGEIAFTGGVNAVTFDEVARRSGVAKTTIYRHFPTKNDLIVHALDQATSHPELPDTGTLRQDLLEFFREILPIFDDPGLRAASLDLMAAAARDPELDQLHRSKVQERITPMHTIFDRARRRGELPYDLDYTDAFDFLEGPFMVRTLLYPEKLRDLDLERTVDRIVAALQA